MKSGIVNGLPQTYCAHLTGVPGVANTTSRASSRGMDKFWTGAIKVVASADPSKNSLNQLPIRN